MRGSKSSKRCKKTIALALVFMLACTLLCSASAFAQDTEPTTVRIGYIDYNGFIDKTADGTYTGYGIAYLNEIAQYTNWQYEFVYDTWDNQMQAVKDGTIDFICHAQKTPEREEEYLFSKYASGSESSVLYVRKDDTSHYYNDFEGFNGLRVAVLNGSYQNDEFAQYALEHDFTYEKVIYENGSDCFAALDAGEVDAVAMGSLSISEGYKIICRFGADPFYFITGKQNEALMRQLNDAMGQISGINPYFQADLYQEYYGSVGASAELLFTREESEYVASTGNITVGVQNRPPLSYADENGEPTGMLVDLMKLVGERSGLQFNFTFLPDAQTGYDFLTNTDGRLVAGVMASAFSTPNPALLQSETLQQSEIVFVGKNGIHFGPDEPLCCALPMAFINGEEMVANQYPNFTFVKGVTSEDCLQKIVDGEADVMLQNMYVVRNSLQNPRYDALEIFPAYSFEEDAKVVALPEDKRLISIINKSIASLTEEEKNDVVIRYTVAQTYKTSLPDLLYKYRAPFAGILFLLAACITLLVALLAARQHGYKNAMQSNKQLAEAVAQADNANRAKSQFLTRMSHEIRTPMNAIVGLTAIAKRHENEPEKMDEYLGKIDSSSRVLLNIINDVLDMSAIESDKIKIDNSPFNLRELLMAIATIYYPQCKQKKVYFEMNTAGIEHEKLIGDGLRVNQILLNLISNAYKFTPEGGRIIITANESHAQDKTVYVTFVVEDTGEGMTEEMQKRLFRPFEQEAANTAQKHGGSGLGLSIAKNLVELMSGNISVQSQKGVGSTFTVSLPFTMDEEEREKKQVNLKQLRALIIDDDTNSREYASVILDRIGVPHDAAEGGVEALEKLTAAKQAGIPFDLCFVDWKMPNMNGGEVTRKIRERFSKKMLVIVASAYDTAEIRSEAIASGANVFVTKPLFQSTVFNLLMELSDGQYVNNTAPEEITYDFTGRKVLLAEDTDLNAEIAIELLEMVHLQVERAADGGQAVEMFKQSAVGSYDAILMDVQMPVMDGYEATKAIRAMDRPDAKTVPILAMTANAFAEDVSHALSIGMDGHIAKPIDTEVLYGTLKKFFDKQAAH